jgi:signal transduction histidine kinase
MLALSFLFAFVVARGLTRRLESVSQVATAIAAGDLSSRAPVTARNEIGRLAENINRMAAHLETTMGELQQARSQAIEALRTRQELVANISHELRTPLAILRAHLETLPVHEPVHEPVPAGTAPARGGEDIAVPETTVLALQQETARLGALVDDLFALSRAQAGRIEMRIQPVDVAAVADEVAQVMRPLAAKEGMIALSVESSPGLPYALADADRLRQIISNLVRNAVRHTPEGGIIALSVTAQPHWVVIAVADTGEGIAAEHLPHIFDRFYRVDESRSRESGGAGLGLAIVQEFVELMGGQVGVESRRGEGTTFSVFLPISR